MRTRVRGLLAGVASGAVYLAVVLWTAVPLVWLVVTSLKPAGLLYTKPPRWIFTPTFDSYRTVIENIPFISYFLNSLLVAGLTTVGAGLLGTVAAYGLSRFRSRATQTVSFLVLVTRMVPRVALVVPYFMLALRLRLLDTYVGMVFAYVAFALPFGIWMLIAFFDQVPTSIDEAAMVDGCSRGSAFLRVVLPLTAPGLVVTTIFSFLLSWNEFLFALVLSGNQTKTLPVVIAGFNTDVGPLYNEMSAAAVMVVIPIVLLTLLLQRFMVSGLTMGSVKG